MLALFLFFNVLSVDPPATELEFRPALDYTFASAGILAAGSLAFFEAQLLSSSCRWCDRDARGENDLNSLDTAARDHLRWSNTSLAQKLSHFNAYVLAPAWAAGTRLWSPSQQENWRSFTQDVVSITEVASLAAVVGQIVKYSVARERPSRHFATSGSGRTENTSFYSNHANLAFALATSSGTLASMRNEDSAPWVWGVGLSLATLTGYLRIASDRHYLSDVLMGAAAGTLIGFAVPYYLHSPKKKSSPQSFNFQIAPIQGGASFQASFNW